MWLQMIVPLEQCFPIFFLFLIALFNNFWTYNHFWTNPLQRYNFILNYQLSFSKKNLSFCKLSLIFVYLRLKKRYHGIGLPWYLCLFDATKASAVYHYLSVCPRMLYILSPLMIMITPSRRIFVLCSHKQLDLWRIAFPFLSIETEENRSKPRCSLFQLGYASYTIKNSISFLKSSTKLVILF